MKLIFVRHGKDDDRYRGGWSNLDLTPEGILQAESLSKHLNENRESYNISYIITSDLQRALTTAEIIAKELNIPVLKEENLREMNNGELAGILNSDADKLYLNLYFHFLDMDERYPNGESPTEFYMRIKLWFNNFISTHKNDTGNVMVVTHGGVINIIYHLVNGIEWSNKNTSFKIGNCSLHILDFNGTELKINEKTI